MVSPSPLIMGRENLFPKNAFHWGTNFVGKFIERLFYMGGLIIRGKEFHKMHFPII